MEDRIIDLEIRIAHQDQVIQALDEVIRAFTARVDELERQVRALRGATGVLPVGPADDPPPHY